MKQSIIFCRDATCRVSKGNVISKIKTIPRENGKTEKAGFTLVELVIVIICAIIVLAPMMGVFRTGTRSSFKGMLQIDTVQEARRILRQIHNDLKSSCFIQKEAKHELNFSSMMTVGGTVLSPVYSFVTFPFQGETQIALPVEKQGPALRRASRLSYILEPGKGDKGLGRLLRCERFHPDHPLAALFPPSGIQTRILSNRVNFFSIEPFAISSNKEVQYFFWVSLKIVDAFQPSALEAKALGNIDKPGEFLLQRSRGIVIAEFHDVVASDFFNSIWNHPDIRRNWHTGASAP